MARLDVVPPADFGGKDELPFGRDPCQHGGKIRSYAKRLKIESAAPFRRRHVQPSSPRLPRAARVRVAGSGTVPRPPLNCLFSSRYLVEQFQQLQVADEVGNAGQASSPARALLVVFLRAEDDADDAGIRPVVEQGRHERSHAEAVRASVEVKLIQLVQPRLPGLGALEDLGGDVIGRGIRIQEADPIHRQRVDHAAEQVEVHGVDELRVGTTASLEILCGP